MKLGMTRWKTVLSYKGTPFITLPVFGSVHSFVPSANPIKFATVLGACLGKRVHFILPIEVSKIASGSAAGVVGLVAVDLAAPVVAVLGFAAVVEGFFADVVDRISDERLRDRVMDAVLQKAGGSAGALTYDEVLSA